MNCTLLTTSTLRATRIIALWTIGLGLLGAPSLAQTNDANSSNAQIWVINTRCASTCGPNRPDEPRISYWLLGDDRQWLAVDRGGFLAADHAGVPTIIFIHGNRADSQTAINDGWQIYGSLKQQAGGRPFRFVIWSWPSEQIQRRVLEDTRIKAGWSDTQAYYLAGLVRQIRPEVPVAMIGYSFGARTITGSLEMLAGGQVAGLSLSDPAAAPQRQLRAVLLAAALDNDWLLPGHRNGNALSQVQHMLVSCNGADPVLKRYHWLYRGCYAEAMGYAGPACPASLGPDREKLELVDVSCWVGKNHDFTLYANAGPAESRLGWYCFLAETGPQPVATTKADVSRN